MLWREIQRKNFIHWEKLADFLELTLAQRKGILSQLNFPLNLPIRLAEKIEKSTLEDPILRQFLPTTKEKDRSSGFVLDPVGDDLARKCGKLIHKYEGRVLLICSSACAMHCRYCFRQNFDYEVKEKGFEKELEMISQDPSIREVILSGGDPLSLSNDVLKGLLKSLDEISHVTRIRFHSRFPIGIPERIDEEFQNILKNLRSQVWFVLHCNHPRELDTEVISRLQSLQKFGAVLLNQAVLLRGVNDSVETQKELCETLVDHGILPYYLHQLDRVKGAAHFEVPEEEGIQIMQELSSQLSGYAVPKYVREVAGEESKTPIYS